jgi:predicted dehydrogenase
MMCNFIRNVFLFSMFIELAAAPGGFAQQQNVKPVRIVVAGIAHGHVGWILGRKDKGDIELVGVFEKDTQLINRYRSQFHLPPELFYTDLARMLDALKPEAAVAFCSIQDHLTVVQACAPRGIHVMVEKPLAISLEEATLMQSLAQKNHILLLTNYETSWYPTTAKAFQLANDSNLIGPLRKFVFHHGHQGPKEIGVQKEFLDFLTDPQQNGGALTDFGCYGANLVTYFLKGQQPTSVTGILKTYKPNVYPKVEDDATVIVQYPDVQAIIQASWNWPFGRKDMEIYGDSGYVITKNNKEYLLRTASAKEEQRTVTENEIPVYTDPFSYFSGVIRGTIKLEPFSPYTLENNMQVVTILSLARKSAKEGRTVFFKR